MRLLKQKGDNKDKSQGPQLAMDDIDLEGAPQQDNQAAGGGGAVCDQATIASTTMMANYNKLQ